MASFYADEAISMKKIRVSLGKRSYNILIGRGLIHKCGRIIKALDIGKDAVVITNSRIAQLYGRAVEKSLKRSGFTVRFELAADSEKAKSLSSAGTILNRLGRYDVKRRIFIAALGGGVIGDLAGFVASIYRRGIPYIQIPTTLLAQVDSSIGGKTAVDLAAAKNLVGSFHQPRVVISDVSALGTLSSRQMRNGLAEVIKYGVIKDSSLFGYLEVNHKKALKLEILSLEHVVSRSAKIKADIVAKDEFDRKRARAILNYGHTIGHAIEAADSYSGRYDHGEAVALGMIAAGRIAIKLGLFKEPEALRVEELIRNCGLPVSINNVSRMRIYEAHLHDKKFSRRNRFILASRIGSAKAVDGVPDSVIRGIISSL